MINKKQIRMVLFGILLIPSYGFSSNDATSDTFRFVCTKSSKSPQLQITAHYTLTSSSLTDVAIKGERGLNLYQKIANAESGYNLRNPRFKEFYRFNFTPL
ncbi:MAG: hypothetical protein SGI74_08525 [Oligoflexia bacterium]|nr:hypothetical protein [Oligoflexia bacterium]